MVIILVKRMIQRSDISVCETIIEKLVNDNRVDRKLQVIEFQQQKTRIKHKNIKM